MFGQDGLLKFCIRPHDIKELTPIATRYGVIDDAQQTFVREACALPQLHSMFDKEGGTVTVYGHEKSSETETHDGRGACRRCLACRRCRARGDVGQLP